NSAQAAVVSASERRYTHHRGGPRPGTAWMTWQPRRGANHIPRRRTWRGSADPHATIYQIPATVRLVRGRRSGPGGAPRVPLARRSGAATGRRRHLRGRHRAAAGPAWAVLGREPGPVAPDVALH